MIDFVFPKQVQVLSLSSVRVYSYYIEVSADGNNWTRIIDYRAYLCRSWQKLYFPPTVAKYEEMKYFKQIYLFYFSFIRVVGTHNSVNKVFHLVSMEVYYKEKSFGLIQDIHGENFRRKFPK